MAPKLHLALLVGLLWVTPPGSCFNLETREAQVFAFPSEKKPQDREPYFGFAVALQKHHANGSAWLVVGSPRANSSQFEPGITEPGTVFKCHLDSGLCEELKLDKDYGNGNLQGSRNSLYKNYKHGGWVGGALDTQPTYGGDRQATAVCSPRWINQESKFYRNGHYRMNGVCYWINDSSFVASVHKMMPLSIRLKQAMSVHGRHLPYYYNGQVGFSVHFTSDPTEMILGAPGVLNWAGTVVRVKDLDVNFQEADGIFFSNYIVPNPLYTSEIEDFDLLGYAVTSGMYLKPTELLYGAGAPRGANILGKVIIFSFPGDERHPLDVRQEMVGQQPGANFGASLTSADINGDGLSDLVVGAPMFSHEDHPDIGEVVVYLSSMNSERLHQASIAYHGSSVIGARFGTTLASLGDLNKDNYEDFAVGAPFEGDGAVYIFLGSGGELPSTHSQRLAAESFNSGFRGFGIALSRGIDIDGNTYPDLAIGSFLSGHAVVVKSRPVARLNFLLTASPSNITVNDDGFQIDACFQFSGDVVPSQIDINGTLTLDPQYSRVSFPTGSNYTKFAEKLDLRVNKCKSYNVRVTDLIQNPHEPIELRLEFGLVESSSGSIIDKPVAEPVTSSVFVGISSGCIEFQSKICHTDMSLEANFLQYRYGEKLVIGGDNRPAFTVSVYNAGEPAFLPILTVEVEPPLALLLPTSRSCSFPEDDRGERTSMACNLTSPIIDTEDTVELNLDTSHLRDTLSSVRVNVGVTAQGIEATPEDTQETLTLDLEAETTLNLRGYSHEQQIRYNLDIQGNMDITEMKKVRHSFELVKEGRTPVAQVLLNIYIPVRFQDGEEFVTIFHSRSNYLGQPVQCKLYEANFAIDSSEDPGIQITNNTSPYGNPTTVSAISESGKVMVGDRTMDLKCISGVVECARLICQVNSWPSDTSVAKLSIEMGFRFGVLAEYMNAEMGGLFKTSAKAYIYSLNPNLALSGHRTAAVEVVTYLQPESPVGAGVP